MNRDDPRAALSRAVATCRRVLAGDRTRKETGDIGAQLDAPYGFDPDSGVPRPMEEMGHLKSWQVSAATMLRDWHAHLVEGAAGATAAAKARAAYDQMKYEIGYTALHRLSALRMAEERGIVRECVRHGRESAGFQTFSKLGGDSGLGDHDETYAFFLARLYDDLARDLPAVFDRRAPWSLIAPRADALRDVLAAIRAPELTPLWSDDETLGWIFEDFNDADERKEMREHDAPRNARELAVRNQFFTPRWVVAFLTDNTLGRLWFDLSGGETALAETCRFLLKPGEVGAPGSRDPRTIKILDPACGSGHFLLYVFDLLEIIYKEAWQGKHHRSEGYEPLWKEFPDEKAFEREVPRLILAHNLYGVDIDPRCIQEAGLALWLRAHKSWEALGVKAKDRPRIAKVNLVCAQALSDSEGLKEKLKAKLKHPEFGQLVDALFLKVAEMGVLLRVEDAIRETVEGVKKKYVIRQQETAQRDMFGEVVGARQRTLDEAAEVQNAGADARFWRDADKFLIRALEELAEEAEDKEAYWSRLFAEEVRHEVEFFDLNRIRYDVVLMNPPFGEPSASTKGFLDANYPNAGHDLYAMFYERALEMLGADGRVGAITNRAWLALPTLATFRREVLGKKGRIEVVADLGYGALNAKVETAAAVVHVGGDLDASATWVRLVKTGHKEETLLEALATGGLHRVVSVVSARHFETLPAMVCGYWMSGDLANVFKTSDKIGNVVDVKQGTATADDGRFLRLAWEVSAQDVGLVRTWARFAKGGEYRSYYDDVHLVMRWMSGGKEIGAFPRAYIRNATFYGQYGITWPLRNQRFGPRVLPGECAFGHKGPSAFPTREDRLLMLAVLASDPVSLLLSIRVGIADDDPKAISPAFEVGVVRDLPWPTLKDDSSKRLTSPTREAVELVRLGQIEEDDTGETVVAYALPPALLPLADGTRPTTLEAATAARVTAREDRLIRLAAIQAEIDDIVATAYGFSDRDRQVMDEELEPPLANLTHPDPIDEALFRTAYLTKDPLDGERLPGGLEAEQDVRIEHRRKKQVQLRDETTLCRLFQAPPAQIAAVRRRLALLRPADLERAAADIVSYAAGVAFGRWDIRLWQNPAWIPTFADPFDPMPPCPLGQLVDAHGLPATPDRIASEDWLALRTDPTKLPEGPPASFEITAESYPIPVAWNGILEDDTLHDTLPRRPEESFLARVHAVLEHLFGAARSDWEHDLARALGATSIDAWLRDATPKGFFADHLARYTKSRRQAPIYWPITTPNGGLTFWIYAPRFDAGTLPHLTNRLRQDLDHLRDTREILARNPTPSRADIERLAQLGQQIDERLGLAQEIQRVLDWGYEPHPDDGFVVTLSPLHFAFRFSKWSTLLRDTWRELDKDDSEYLWAHLAMRRRPAAVLARCKTDRSIAIAHGREDLYEVPAEKKRGRKPAAKKTKAGGGARAQFAFPAVDAPEPEEEDE